MAVDIVLEAGIVLGVGIARQVAGLEVDTAVVQAADIVADWVAGTAVAQAAAVGIVAVRVVVGIAAVAQVADIAVGVAAESAAVEPAVEADCWGRVVCRIVCRKWLVREVDCHNRYIYLLP